MSQLIAGIYEIDEQIGAGGGGIVYLARHTRLNKKVVLKADKRKLSANEEVLRREVDMLKNLSHTYIPQVYDFVQDGETVYTVMDYIEGESLDKILARKQKISQAQIVGWAIELLEALVYLHSQPPFGILHGDIKPANIMLRPNGDICLIDYNIALALGEDGAVKVGFSRGYASPEHYGADYIKRNSIGGGKIKSFQSSVYDSESTETVSLSDRSRNESDSSASCNSGSVSGRGVLLDVRSDVYSLAATLYHLLKGEKPSYDARNVKKLTSSDCSASLADIINKAMSAQPDDRYQSAQEMLKAFRELPRNDRRMVRHRTHIRLTAMITILLWVIGGVGTFVGLSQLKSKEKALVLAEYSATALAKGDISKAIEYAVEAIPAEKHRILEHPVIPQARDALANALGVYDLDEEFLLKDSITLSTDIFKLRTSRDGKRLAILYAYKVDIYDTSTMECLAQLDLMESALSDIEFVNDDFVVFAGPDGVTGYDLRANKEVWSGNPATTLALSGDSTTLAAVYRDDSELFVYDTYAGELKATRDLGEWHLWVPENDIYADAETNLFCLDDAGEWLGISSDKGGIQILNLNDQSKDLILYDATDYEEFDGCFQRGILAYVANGDEHSVFGLVDINNEESLGEYSIDGRFIFNSDDGKVNWAVSNLFINYDIDNMSETELAYTDSLQIDKVSVCGNRVLITTDDDSFYIFEEGTLITSGNHGVHYDFIALTENQAFLANRSDKLVRVYHMYNAGDACVASYNPSAVHEEARISEDGETLMLFDFAHFQIFDKNGNFVNETEFPNSDKIYDMQFRKAAESYLEVIWYDGIVNYYSARDGRMMETRQITPPSKDLYEEFETTKYRFESTLHEPVEVYDIESGNKIATLDEDAELVYVTEVGEYVIAEYFDMQSKRYGILLDENMETVAHFPNMSDFYNNQVVFDYGKGKLFASKIYTTSELLEIAKEQ